MKTELTKAYVTVENGHTASYGGNQKAHPDPAFQKDACGVIAGTDLFLYLSEIEKNTDPQSPVTLKTEQDYFALADMLNQVYLPYKKDHGMSGFVFARGMNRCFRKNKLPYRMYWGIPRRFLLSSIERMLSKNLPVVLTVGPAAPWKKAETRKDLKLYQRSAQGEYKPVTATRGHYMVVTGITKKWIRVSSWGERYYIRRSEYLDYAQNHSFYFYTNVFYIRRKSGLFFLNQLKHRL